MKLKSHSLYCFRGSGGFDTLWKDVDTHIIFNILYRRGGVDLIPYELMKIYKWWERPGWRQTCFTPRGPNCKSHSLAAIHKPNCNPKSEPRIIWLFSKLSCQIILSWWPICPDDSAHEFYLKQTWLLLTIGRAPWSNNKTRFFIHLEGETSGNQSQERGTRHNCNCTRFFFPFSVCASWDHLRTKYGIGYTLGSHQWPQAQPTP